MKKSTWLIIGIIVLALLAMAMGWLIVTHSGNNKVNTNTTSNVSDQTVKTEVTVTIKNMAFSPANIKITKGTKVTWVNKDTVGHSIVADHANNVADLPTTNTPFDNNQSYSYTFNTLGTVTYHCGVHQSMTGSIEVVQ